MPDRPDWILSKENDVTSIPIETQIGMNMQCPQKIHTGVSDSTVKIDHIMDRIHSVV
jgi:hypothetical protein